MSIGISCITNRSITARYSPIHQFRYLLYDGHRSHISLSLIKWAQENNIILFVPPPLPVYTREGMVLEVSITNGFNGCMPVLLNEERKLSGLKKIFRKLYKLVNI
jgi:hypothetical protein